MKAGSNCAKWATYARLFVVRGLENLREFIDGGYRVLGRGGIILA
jgi:hypothetical protein